MNIEIQYTSFNLSADTEAVVSTPRTLLFFEEMEIPYTIDSRPCDSAPFTKNWIEYSQDYGTISVDVDSVDELREFAERYGARIIMNKSKCSIDFVAERMNVEPTVLHIKKKRV
jgi:hypothetical protein